MSDSIQYKFKGRIFNEEGIAIIREMQTELVRQSARVAEQAVHESQSQSFKNPTGKYESSIRIEGTGVKEQITDGGMIYGPWLEGVGSRNKTTRFKGYHIMRTVTTIMNRERVKVIIQTVAPRFIARLNE